MLFATPPLDAEDNHALDELEELRRHLADVLRPPRRWEPGLRRSMLARHLRGSNRIDGYDVEVDDAAAALDDEPPLSAPEPAFAAVRGYRQALGYVLATAGDPHLRLDPGTLRSLHYMLLGHEPAVSPGRYRTGPAPVAGPDGAPVYEGADAEEVPALVEELMTRLEGRRTRSRPVVLAATAHLNLVKIRPFRSGNGRMARLLASLVLARSGLTDPVDPLDLAFAGIDEWLGAHAGAYEGVLARTGAPSWDPAGDAQLWMKFGLRAHHLQAQITAARFDDAIAMYAAFDLLTAETGLPERVYDPLLDATLGFRVRRATYIKRAGIQQRTATRDLTRLVELELLTPRGETKGRHYVAGPILLDLAASALTAHHTLTDPYPSVPLELG